MRKHISLGVQNINPYHHSRKIVQFYKMCSTRTSYYLRSTQNLWQQLQSFNNKPAKISLQIVKSSLEVRVQNKCEISNEFRI